MEIRAENVSKIREAVKMLPERMNGAEVFALLLHIVNIYELEDDWSLLASEVSRVIAENASKRTIN